MEKEDLVALINALIAMKEYSPKIEQALKDKDMEKLSRIKKEILGLSKSVDRML